MDSMKARHYAPVAPLDTEPLNSYTKPERREEALRDALRGAELGSYDQRMIAWAIRTLDDSTVRVIVSWLERVRGAGMVDVLDVEGAIQRNARASRARQEIRERERHAAAVRRQDERRGVPGNAGPGY